MRWLYLFLLSLGLTGLIWVSLASGPVYKAQVPPGSWKSPPLAGETYLLLRTQAEVEEALQGLPSSVTHALEEAAAPLLLAYLGEAPSGGYNITITRVQIIAEEMEVTLSRRSPNPDSMVIMVLTHPFDILPLDLADLPYVVRFRSESGEILAQH